MGHLGLYCLLDEDFDDPQDDAVLFEQIARCGRIVPDVLYKSSGTETVLDPRRYIAPPRERSGKRRWSAPILVEVFPDPPDPGAAYLRGSVGYPHQTAKIPDYSVEDNIALIMWLKGVSYGEARVHVLGAF